jgi:hypothetical protein
MGITDRKTSTLNNSITFDVNADLYTNATLNLGVGKSGGFVNRKKSGKIFAGSRMVVPGQDILSVKVFEPDFNRPRTIDTFSGALPPTPTAEPTPTPTPTPPPTSTPTPTPTPTMTPSPIVEICYLATEDFIRIIAENGDNLIVDCDPFPIPVPPVNYPTPTPTPTIP